MKDWHCYINNQAYGSYPENFLKELIDRGQLTIDTYVYNDSPEDAPKGWQRAGDTEIAALFPNNPQRTPPLPPIQNTETSRVSPAVSQENAENCPQRFLNEGETRVLRGTSNTPLILGIIGSVLGVPALVPSVYEIVVMSSLVDLGDVDLRGVMWIGGLVIDVVLEILSLILGIVGGIKDKSNPKKSCLFLMIAAVLAAIVFAKTGWHHNALFMVFYLDPFIMYLCGAIIAYT